MQNRQICYVLYHAFSDNYCELLSVLHGNNLSYYFCAFVYNYCVQKRYEKKNFRFFCRFQYCSSAYNLTGMALFISSGFCFCERFKHIYSFFNWFIQQKHKRKTLPINVYGPCSSNAPLFPEKQALPQENHKI